MAADRTVAVYEDLSITVAEAGVGRPALILHGGGGRVAVDGLPQHLAKTMRTITPVHPGWDGTPRPAWCTGVDDLALAYLHLLHDQGLNDVLVVGSSLGGWIAAEMAVRDSARLISGLVLIDAVGVLVEGEPIRDVFALDDRNIAERAFHDPDRFYLNPAFMRADLRERRDANLATTRALAATMHDPKLLRRLARVDVPTLLLWGESDQIVTPAYGAKYASAFPNAHFELVTEAGHLPHVERPDAVAALLDAHLATSG